MTTRLQPAAYGLTLLEAEARILNALRRLLEMQRGNRARVKAKHVVLLLHGIKPRATSPRRIHVHRADLFLTVAVLREAREVEAGGYLWRLNGVEFSDGWVFTYDRVRRRAG